MNVFEVVVMIVLMVIGLFLIFAVLMQHGKSHGLSGTIAGGAETFYGKEKGSRIDRRLGRWTTVIGIVFILAAVALYVKEPSFKYSRQHELNWGDGLSSYYNSETKPSEMTDEELNAVKEYYAAQQ